MSETKRTKWIETMIAQTASPLPVLPWTRAAKHARRLAAVTAGVTFELPKTRSA